MRSGEPGDRTFDAAMSADPIRWLSGHLRDLDGLLQTAEGHVAEWHRIDADAVADVADEIVDAARAVLETCRQPWPEVDHDERGMAIASAPRNR